MNDAMNILFQFAQERLEKPLLFADPEYENVQQHAAKQETRLRSMLNDEAKQCLDDFLDELSLLQFFEDQALFRAGFQLAMELGRP